MRRRGREEMFAVRGWCSGVLVWGGGGGVVRGGGVLWKGCAVSGRGGVEDFGEEE